MVVHACNSSTWEAEVGGSQVQGQPALYRETLTLKKQKTPTLRILIGTIY
jgi:hypothetical protein